MPFPSCPTAGTVGLVQKILELVCNCASNLRCAQKAGGRDEGLVAGEEGSRALYGWPGGSEKGVFSTSLDALLSVPLGLTDVTR